MTESAPDSIGRGPVEGVFGVCLFGDMVSNLCYYDLSYWVGGSSVTNVKNRPRDVGCGTHAALATE